MPTTNKYTYPLWLLFLLKFIFQKNNNNKCGYWPGGDDDDDNSLFLEWVFFFCFFFVSKNSSKLDFLTFPYFSRKKKKRQFMRSSEYAT